LRAWIGRRPGRSAGPGDGNLVASLLRHDAEPAPTRPLGVIYRADSPANRGHREWSASPGAERSFRATAGAWREDQLKLLGGPERRRGPGRNRTGAAMLSPALRAGFAMALELERKVEEGLQQLSRAFYITGVHDLRWGMDVARRDPKLRWSGCPRADLDGILRPWCRGSGPLADRARRHSPAAAINTGSHPGG